MGSFWHALVQGQNRRNMASWQMWHNHPLIMIGVIMVLLTLTALSVYETYR